MGKNKIELRIYIELMKKHVHVHLRWTGHQTTRHLTKNYQWTHHLNQDQN